MINIKYNLIHFACIVESISVSISFNFDSIKIMLFFDDQGPNFMSRAAPTNRAASVNRDEICRRLHELIHPRAAK